MSEVIMANFISYERGMGVMSLRPYALARSPRP